MPPEFIDLRSDTVTRPTPAMREAMAAADVGDDQFGEDPTVNLLQQRMADVLGKEAALWLPTGTMANQVALRTLTQPGDDVIVCRESHAVWHETGAGGANAGVQFTEIGSDGVFSADECLGALKPANHLLYPPTTLVQVENTHNRAGGIIVPQDDVQGICMVARARAVSSYLDGARLWNAAIASDQTPAQLAGPFDVVGVSFSKGLGAPGGAVLAGTRAFVQRATRYRRMQGGAMRQVGIFAAAALYALDHHMARLADDHEHARVFAGILSRSRHVILDQSTVQTNIVVFRLAAGAPDAARVVARARTRGVLLFAFGPRTLRVVTHLDVSRAAVETAARTLVEIVDGQA